MLWWSYGAWEEPLYDTKKRQSLGQLHIWSVLFFQTSSVNKARVTPRGKFLLPNRSVQTSPAILVNWHIFLVTVAWITAYPCQINYLLTCDNSLGWQDEFKSVSQFLGAGFGSTSEIYIHADRWFAIFLKSCPIKPKSDCICHFLIDLELNGNPFGSNSIRRW